MWRRVLFVTLTILLVQESQGKTHHKTKKQNSDEPGKKRDSKSGANSGANSQVGAKTGAATASDSSSESQTFTNTKVNTRISTKSNARSGANAAAKVKTFAHANTETKVDTQQLKPQAQTTVAPTVTTEGGKCPNKIPDVHGKNSSENGTGSGGSHAEANCNSHAKPPIINVFCPQCPCPCPPPCPCVCPCALPPPPPPPPCPIPCPPPCPCVEVLQPYPQYPQFPPCPMDCPVPPCPCIYKRSNLTQTLRRRSRNKKSVKTKKTHKAGSKRVHSAGEQPDLASAKPLEFEKAAVAADNEICSKIGAKILKKGGTAADAVVSTHCCVEIVNSHSTGLGGGGFMVYYDSKSGTSKAYDFRETLPAAYSDTQNKTQGETILVPGVLRGLEAVWKDFGKLPWKDLWQPCIKLAKKGFYIHSALAMGIAKKADFIANQTQGDTVLVPGVLKGLHRVWLDYGKLDWDELWQPCIELAEKGFKIHEALHNAIDAKQKYIMENRNLMLLYAPKGVLLKLGDTLKRPVLAKTFKKIAASNGSEIFYTGEIAKQIVQDISLVGGKMTADDLANYKVVVRDPLKTKIKGLTMLSTPPPGSGALISLALKIMDNYNWTPEDQYKERGLLFHRIVEAMKFAYAPFTYLGDPRHTNNTEQVCKYMLSDKVAKNMWHRIDNVSHTVQYYGPFSTLKHEEKSGTSHMSLIDKYGNAVGATTSINAYFGSKVRSQSLGFIYNNELADFSEFWPNVYNLTKDKKVHGKRPMSKSSPTIFLDKDDVVVGVFGAAGGFFIPTCLIQTIANWLFFHNNIKVAITKPRLHCQLFPPTVVYEPTFPQELIPQLESYSHAYVTNSTYDVSGQLNAIMGVVQAVVRLPNGKLNADCDYRKGGKPAGF